ncbi:MAG: sialidase family protein, partial [Streptosporangiaceae bacterium]
VLAVAAAGRSAWALVARCHGRGQRAGPRSGQCPLRLIVSADGGRTWHAARLPGASVPGLGGQPAGPAELVRTSARTAYVLTSPGRTSRLWITRDGGASWTRRPVPCGLAAMSAGLAVAPDGTIVVVCAGQPSAGGQVKTLAWSADGGRTWTVHRPCRAGTGTGCAPLGFGYLGQIAAPAGRTVFLTGPRSSLLVTRDGGRAWHLVRPVIGDSGGGTGAVAFFGRADRDGQADRDGVVFGYDPRHNEQPAIWHTADGGAHWRVVYPVLT